MRKTALTLILALAAAINITAQQRVVIYNGGETVFSKQLWEVDSIVFVADPLPEYFPQEHASAVDFGLKVKWAPTNIGAETPLDRGIMFGWGEPTGLTKSTDLKFSPYDNVNKGLAGTIHDIANATWGNGWRMPTKAEIKELIDNCTWEIIDTIGAKAYKVSRGEAVMYFPLTGYREGDTEIPDSLTYIWSSDIASDHKKAIALCISSEEVETEADEEAEKATNVKATIIDEPRHLGLCVRPVLVGTNISLVREPYAVTYNSAKVDIEVSGGYLSDVTEYGVVCTANADTLPDGEDVKVGKADMEKGYKATIEFEGLNALTTYYYQLYVKATDETIYSSVFTFTTGRNGHYTDYADLGLPSGLWWATMNVGAEKETDLGDYFAWGETEPKTDYSAKTYRMVNDAGEKVDSCLTENGKKVQDPMTGAYSLVNPLMSIAGTQYDAATANWGGQWRMPTRADFKELIDNCSWTWTYKTTTDNNGNLVDVYGYEVTGKNYNSIFLPAAGNMNGSRPYYVDTTGRYWTSELSTNEFSPEYGDTAFPFSMTAKDKSLPLGLSRYMGMTIRPVK